MADFSDLFDSPDFEDLWEQLNKQILPSPKPPCSSETPKTETKTEDIAAPSVLKSLLSGNKQLATTPAVKQEKNQKMDIVTQTTPDKGAVKTELPFKRYTSTSTTSVSTPTTYSPPLDENWPPATNSTTNTPFSNVEDSILTTFRRKNPQKYVALNQRFVEPRVTASREFKVLKALQKRIFMDMQQSEIIVNYLSKKYTDEPENKRVKFSTIR